MGRRHFDLKGILVHHVLAERRFNPPGLTFPVSAAILRLIDDYRLVLKAHSRPILPFIAWQPALKGSVHVLNDTGDFYRFLDATPHTEFLYRCVQATIDEDLRQETAFLQAYDRFAARLQDIADMPGPTLDLLFRSLRQNNGSLSRRAREREFRELTDAEAAAIEDIYAEQLAAV